jgi:hypothetical protein
MSRPTTPNNTKGNAPAALLRDLRGVAAFLALDIVYLKGSLPTNRQHELMSHNFFGHDASDTASTLKKLCNGTEAFYALFEFQPTPAGTDMYTKQHISADGLIYLMNGQSINEEILSRSAFTNAASSIVTGRTLYDAAKTVLANCKKAQSLVPKLVNKVVLLAEDGTVSDYLSGLNEERFLSYINDGMYVMLKKSGKGGEKASNLAEGGVVAGEVVEVANGDDAAAGSGSNVDGDASSVDDPNTLSAEDIAEAAAGESGETQSFRWDNEWMPFGEKAPLGYRFPGYCAFACFGPHTGIYYNRLINPKGNNKEEKSQGKTGRSVQCAEKAKKARHKREYGTDRGLTLDNKIKLASLAQQDESNAQRDKDTRLIALKSAIKSMEDARKSKETLLSVDGLQNEMKTSLLIEINKLNNKILKLNEEMLNLGKEGRKGSRIVAAVMKEAEQRMGIRDGDVEVIE